MCIHVMIHVIHICCSHTYACLTWLGSRVRVGGAGAHAHPSVWSSLYHSSLLKKPCVRQVVSDNSYALKVPSKNIRRKISYHR